MIILVSRDFKPLAQALENLYNEPCIELLDPADWLYDLSADNSHKYISRLSIIGHSDSYYGEEQSFFGGNPSERVMLIEEFAHALLNLLKHNERLNPGFCKHLKHIDLVDCHVGENKFIAETIAKYIQEDAILSEFGNHFIISSFANSKHPACGTVLMPHEDNDEILTFHSFKTNEAFHKYRETHYKLAELRTQLHHAEQMPGHTMALYNGKNKEEHIAYLEKKCQILEKKEQTLLKNHSHKSLHIADPRTYLDKHSACQITVADLPSHSVKDPTMTQHEKKRIKKHQPHFFKPENASSPSSVHTSVLDGNKFFHKPGPGVEEDSKRHPHLPKK